MSPFFDFFKRCVIWFLFLQKIKVQGKRGTKLFSLAGNKHLLSQCCQEERSEAIFVPA
jgi:hypothetical protein